MFPFLAMWKEANDYFAAFPPVCKESNGDLPQQKQAEAAKKADAAKAEAKKTEEKKDDKKEEEKKEDDAVKAGPATRATAAVRGALSAACGAVCVAHARVASLPWKMISNVTLRLGTLFTWVWVFWSLTEDPAVLAIPALAHVVPHLIDRFGKDRLSKDMDAAIREGVAVAVAGLQYYIFKTHIVQY